MSDRDQRTEQPTQRRVQKAREEGRFLSSRELANALQFIALAAILGNFGGHWIYETKVLMRVLMERAFVPNLEIADTLRLLILIIRSQGFTFLVLGAVVIFAPVALQAGLTKLGFTLKSLTPDFGRLDPTRRLGDLPKQNLSSLFQAALLLGLVLTAAWMGAPEMLEKVRRLSLLSLEASLAEVGALVMSVVWKGAVLLLVLGLVDLFRQWRRHTGSLRMTKQEVRDELKESEGNPQVKTQIRRLQRDYARRRMMDQVPTATAVVVNPTHYAVALRYEVESMGAPTVVAKGRNYLAQRIKQIAVEHNVPIIENAPLAQALYKSTEIGQEIPANLYRAVAEILAYLYRIMNGRLPNQGRA